jgi:hypothetical protein
MSKHFFLLESEVSFAKYIMIYMTLLWRAPSVPSATLSAPPSTAVVQHYCSWQLGILYHILYYYYLSRTVRLLSYTYKMTQGLLWPQYRYLVEDNDSFLAITSYFQQHRAAVASDLSQKFAKNL